MNKYIQKCLIIYISIILLLVGMGSVSYAITSTDADKYLTRSKFAVDMAYLQDKIDEKEADLLTRINKYRYTDIKFTTWDTSVNYYSGSDNRDCGFYNGGNYGARQIVSASTTTVYIGSGRYSGSVADHKNGRMTDYSMYRLWNGNYFITRNLYYQPDESRVEKFVGTMNFAVPIENYPGWYLECRAATYSTFGNERVSYIASIVHLDPTIPIVDPPSEGYLIRFKKEYFQYFRSTMSNPITGKTSGTTSVSEFLNSVNIQPFSYVYNEWESTTRSTSIYYETYLDQETGDFMMLVRGLSRCYSPNSSTVNNYSYEFRDKIFTLCKIIPIDNVEHACGNISGAYYTNIGGNVNPMVSDGVPCAALIGTGYRGDEYWQYEIVDCENGIKYWHAYRPPSTVKMAGAVTEPLPYGIHYSLPIVY